MVTFGNRNIQRGQGLEPYNLCINVCYGVIGDHRKALIRPRAQAETPIADDGCKMGSFPIIGANN